VFLADDSGGSGMNHKLCGSKASNALSRFWTDRPNDI
jgi:hypothetical protein